jgi:hypothetical protein
MVEIAVQTEQTASTDGMSAIMESIMRCNAGLLQIFSASVVRPHLNRQT